MKAIAKIFTATSVFLMAGCSGTPSAGDIKKNLESMFSCPAIAIENVKKTNGVDKGNYYSVSYTYTMVFPKGAKNSDEYSTVFGSCPFSTQSLLAYKILGRGSGIGFPIEDGKEVELDGNANMVKSENGWIFE